MSPTALAPTGGVTASAGAARADATGADRTVSPGRTRITARALERIGIAVSAEALGVERRGVSVRLDDDGGSLTLLVTAPLRVVGLHRIASDPALVQRTGGTLLERAETAKERIRARVGELTGSQVARVALRLTGVEIRQESRVR
ncbi:hypothetical protein ACFSBZ_14735 [Amnibacterium flavum]|uniref:NTP pyrophosphohydrolase n=1 Tax=Amnibacterium flavum TaxID=2173173 RepID=A0A2V1HTU2_9MICO|nr:hypothetical protein [Amnibacterium flavum]PVZ95988.1 hypothetical protein DDQ50_05930 [Amnibacterium flavum]